MKKIFPVVLLLAVVPGLLGAGPGVVIKRETDPATERGPDAIQKKLRITLSQAALRYRGTAKRGDIRAITGKYGDHFLGLEFGASSGSHGGWDRWNFLEVRVRSGRHIREATSYNLLEDAYVLEDSQRHMVALRWPLGDQLTAKHAKNASLTLTLLDDASLPGWLFLRVSVDAPATLDRIVLGCYPGNTKGPESRQRWVATPDRQFNVSDKPTHLPANASALAIFNRLGQPRDGCLLAYESRSYKSVNATGNYKVRTLFQPKSGRREAVFALGYFNDTPADDATARFFRDSLSAVRRYLERIDWEPVPDPKQVQDQQQFLDRVVTTYGQSGEAKQWASLKQAYIQARGGGDPIHIAAVVRKIDIFKQNLLERILATFS